MPRCCVTSCNLMTSESRYLSLFAFPSIDKRSENCIRLSMKRRNCWMAALGLTTLDNCELLRVCERHFISGVKSQLSDEHNPDWVPSQNLPEVEAFSGFDDMAGNANENEGADEVGETFNVDVIHRTVATQTEVSVTGASANLFLGYEQKIRLLEHDLSKTFIMMENFEDDAKTCFFTGLTNFATMKAVFCVVEPFLPEVRKNTKFVLTKFQIFIIVLSRMRLNLSFRYLSYKFEVSPQTISKYFHEGLYVMYSKLRSLVYLPSREDIKATMPLSFRERFGDAITIIIDCFEVFIERSILPMAQAQTFSFYKHTHTIKYLIGITPQGMISFISDGFGGRSSDKVVTEKCGLLARLQKDDVVMADRGFLIEDSLKSVGARSEIPAFTKGKTQLHPFDLEHTRKIANLRIEVEQIIGLLRKKYTIFSQRKFPISCVSKLSNKCNITVMDQMITICAALVNLCGPICVKENEL